MRYIILGVLFYCLYLFLKFLINTFFKPKIKSQHEHRKPVPKSRIDISSIEDAEYEEIKK